MGRDEEIREIIAESLKVHWYFIMMGEGDLRNVNFEDLRYYLT